jgi:signal transduction histidine kinase
VNEKAIGAVLRSRLTALGRELGPALVASVLTTAVWLAGWLAPLERSTGDTLLRLTNRRYVDAPVAAVVIDDRSIAAHGPLPWSRAIIADLVVAARRAGATAVALDMLLVEARDRAGDLNLSRALQAGPSLLAAALGRNGQWLLPLPLFGGAASAAHVHAEIGPDGVARTLTATKQAGRLSLPALSLTAAHVVRPDLVIEPGTVLEPDFRPAPNQVAKVSAIDLLSPANTAGVLNGRLVFIGITATGSGDRFIVPTSPGPAPSPGVLVHASATASILANGLVHRPGPVWVLCGILLAALVLQILRTRVGTFQPWSVAAAILVVLLGAAVALELWHFLVPTAPVVVAMVLSVALREGVESRAAQRETGRLLHSLLRHHEPHLESAAPRGSAARLAVVRELQDAVLRQDTARRTLLDSMRDGVVMWDRSGRTAVVNPAATQLWGEEPGRDALLDIKRDHNGPGPATVHRHGREVAVDIFTVGDGGMALLRDVTAERELERKRRDMQRLVSHELKTPLASIAGFGETLQRYQLTTDEQRQVASLIRGESLRLGEMVTTFLDLERLGNGQTEEPMAAVNLGGLCEERLLILSQAARARNLTIVSRLDDTVVVRGSAPLLARVVDNLVGNAIKYSNEGGLIEVSVAHDNGHAILVVADDGQGIAEEALPRLFERFYRVPGVRGAGSGLGLAVANEVVDWHGGCIRVDSIVGKGSTFTVSLPAEG